MNKEVTSKSDRIPEALRTYAAERVGALERFGEAFPKADIVLDSQNGSTSCEVVLHRHRGEPFVARETRHEPRLAVDGAVQKLERQIVKFHETHGHRGRRREA